MSLGPRRRWLYRSDQCSLMVSLTMARDGLNCVVFSYISICSNYLIMLCSLRKLWLCTLFCIPIQTNEIGHHVASFCELAHNGIFFRNVEFFVGNHTNNVHMYFILFTT
jgi:hypothetical protein